MATVLPACGAGTPVTRGFSSRQVLPIRDETFYIRGSGPNFVSYSTGGDGGVIYWYLDVATGQIHEQDQSDGGSDGGAGYICEIGVIDAQTNTASATITDPQTGQQTTIEGVSSILRCPSTDPTLTVLRSGPTGALTLWSGPYDQLQQIPLSVTIAQLAYLGDTAVVFAAFPAQPAALGLFSVDLTTFAVTDLVLPTLDTAAWANGAVATGSLTSVSLVPSLGTVTPIDGRHVYERSMSDGSTTMFAGTFPAGPASELALFNVPATATIRELANVQSQLAGHNVLAWQYEDTSLQSFYLFVWSDDRQRFVTCQLPTSIAEVATASPDGGELMIGATTPWDPQEPGGPTGPLVLVSFGSSAQPEPGTCTLLSSGGTSNAEFSLDGSKMFWLSGGNALWIADGDGTGGRSIIGNIGSPRFVEGTKVECYLGGSLAWVDTTDTSNTFHNIADHSFGTTVDLDVANTYSDGSWVVTGYEYSIQNATGVLGVINRDSGMKRLISPEVAQYVVVPSDAAVDGGGPTVQVVYFVRGRNPSSQDGIWIATIGQADLR